MKQLVYLNQKVCYYMVHLEQEKLLWQEQWHIIQIVHLLEFLEVNWFKSILEKDLN